MKLKDCLSSIIDNRGKNPNYLTNGDYPVIDNIHIKNMLYPNLNSINRYINKKTYNNFLRGYVHMNMPIMTLVGNGIGNVTLAPTEKCVIVQNTIGFNTKKELLNEIYLYYWFKFKSHELRTFNRGTGQPSIKKTDIENMEITIPDIEIQNKIVDILFCIDKKIELNNQINDNLLESINCLYKETFATIETFDKAENVANISIGKTPPRSEKECFTNNECDMKWISISDLGKSGIYIFNTNERLTMDSVDKYNVKIIPKGTIILSFKLTIGRIAITTENMATNEAIAHFDLKNKEMKYYLYSYLKNFDYAKLGSTSSIATAVNSKIIKAMPIGIPNAEALKKYNGRVHTMFEKVLENEKENQILEQLRDILLPKLMNGEIDLDKIET